MTDELIDDLVRGKADFGVETAAMSVSIAPGGNGFALETEFDRAVEAFPEAEAIFERNIETLEALGVDGWAALDVGPGGAAR